MAARRAAAAFLQQHLGSRYEGRWNGNWASRVAHEIINAGVEAGSGVAVVRLTLSTLCPRHLLFRLSKVTSLRYGCLVLAYTAALKAVSRLNRNYLDLTQE